MFARLVVLLVALIALGDAAASRPVVFFGEGHVYLLRQCVIEAPGVDLVEANDYLPK